MDCKDIKRAYDALKSDRQSNLDGILDLIERFVVPFRGSFYQDLNTESQVDWRRRGIYDGTAVMACQTLAASIQGALISPAIKWFMLRFRQSALNENNDALEWLEECETRVYNALVDSNFDLEASEFLLDITSYGSGVIVEEVEDDKEGVLDFSAVPMRDCYFEQDYKGRVVRLYRRFQWTAKQIVTKFGEKDVPQKIKDAAEKVKQDKFDVIFAIYDRPGKEKVDLSKRLAAKARPFGYKYVLAENGEQLGEEGGYYEMPAFVTRWRKTAGSQWGHSPAMVVLSDILTLNELAETTLEALGKVVDPATLTTKRGLLSDLDLGRGGLTVVSDIDAIRPYESRARFDVADLKIERLQMAINRAFYVDQLELKQSPAMTATEVTVRYELMQRLLGPTLGRMQNDFLDPLIKRTFNILYRAGKLPEMPPVVADLQGELDIEYTGPLPRSQKRDTAQSVQNWIMGLANLVELYPELRDLPDVDAIGRGLAIMEGVPAKFVKSETDVEKERKQRAEEEATQRKLAGATAAGEAMTAIGKGAQSMQEGNVDVEQIAQAAGN